jgi:O-antigen/teichoic acid export membrane protein
MLSGRLATQIVLVVSAFIIPRVLGAENYGQYAAVMAVIAIVQTLSSFGLPMVEIRELPPLKKDGSDPARAVELGSTIWVTRLILSAIAGAAALVWLAASQELAGASSILIPLGLLAFLRSAYEASRSQLLPLGSVNLYVGLDFLRVTLVLVVVVAAFSFSGLDGVFMWFSAVFVILLPVALGRLRSILPLRLLGVRWHILRRFTAYAVAAFVGELSLIAQQQFAVYVVAVRVNRLEAGVLALTIQLLTLLQVLFLTGQAALMPILAEFNASGQTARLRLWGSLMMRYGAAISCLACVGWALLGNEFLAGLLPPAFAPVHRTGTVILVGAVFFCGAMVCNGLLYIRGLPWLASASSIVYAATTVGGVLLILDLDSNTALWISSVYAVASVVFFSTAYLLLALGGQLWLPLRRTLLLMLPVVCAWPAVTWQANPTTRAAALVGFAVLYIVGAVALRLLPADEVREIWGTVVARRRKDETA